MPTTLGLDQSKDLKLVYRKGEGRAITFRIRENGNAHDISGLEFIFEVMEIDSSTPIFQLLEDSGLGLVNEGVTGILTADPGDDDVYLDAKTYQWKLRTISPKQTWFNGLFVINDAPQRTTFHDGASVELDLGDIVVEVDLSVAGNGIGGPDVAVDENFAGFDGTTGQFVKDSGFGPSSFLSLLKLCAAKDISNDLYPTTGGTGDAGAVLRGNIFPVAVSGAPGGEQLPVSTLLLALVDTPGQTSTNWRAI